MTIDCLYLTVINGLGHMQLTNNTSSPRLDTAKALETTLLVDRTFDYYVLCSLKLKDAVSYPHRLYWRMIDEQFCLFELAIDWHTGLLVSFTIVFYKGTINRVEQHNFFVDDVDMVGIPYFERSLWPNVKLENYDFSMEFREIKQRFSIQLKKSNLYIGFFEDIVVYRAGLPGFFSCGFNQNKELCNLVLYNLNITELALIEEYMEKNKESAL